MRNKLIKLVTLLILLFSLGACVKETETKYEKVEDLDGQTFGILVGTICDDLTTEEFPNSEQQFYSSTPDLVTSLTEGKVEAFLSEAGYIKRLCKENQDLTYFSDSFQTNVYGSIYPKTQKGQEDVEDFNEFLKEFDESGKLDTLYDKWFLPEDYSEDIDYESLENINGEYRVSCDGYTYPFNFMYNGKLTGFEIELLYNYCFDRGYSLHIEQLDFSASLAAVSTGKVQAGFAAVIYTEERAQSFLFSDVYAHEDIIMCIRKENAAYKYNNINDLKNQMIGVLSGSMDGELVEKQIEGADILYYNTIADTFKALDDGKIDAACTSNIALGHALDNRNDIKAIGNVGISDIAFILKKDESSNKLRNELNEFIAKIQEDGRMDDLYDEWFDGTKEKGVDYSGLKNVNGVINAACCSGVGGNICYYNGEKLYGMDVEIIVEFAKEYGYDVNFQDYDLSGLLSAVTSGKADVGFSCLSITAERKQTLYFTDPIYQTYENVYVKTGSATVEDEGFIEGIKDSFYKTFILEDRYKLFVEGIDQTLLITFLSMIFGFILGAVLYYLFRRNNKVMNRVLAIYDWLINGMPTVVLLMVFFYIIFGKTKLSGTVVSIIAFTCVFSVSIMGLLKTCFMAVDKGQFEAAYALGYTKKDTIRKIIIPEIAPMFFPSFRADVISLLKSTSIVGYIAVQDLTKASDIVRSRTYEAFFPLIVTTIIYFILGALINTIIKYIEKKLNTKNRTKEEILKGVNYHD